MRITPAMLLLFFSFAPLQALAADAAQAPGLSSAEQSYYEKVFYYTMDNVQPGQKFDWASYSGKGTINVDAPFVSKSGSTCRNFSETYTVQGKEGAGKGVACKRGGEEGWCKLKTDNALTCAMEGPPSLFTGATGIALPNVDVPGVNVSGNVNVGGIAPTTNPNLNPGIDAPAPGHKPTGQGVADSVTSAAGSVAGPAAGGAISWFGKTFR